MLDEKNIINDVGVFNLGFGLKLERSEGHIEKNTIVLFDSHCHK